MLAVPPDSCPWGLTGILLRHGAVMTERPGVDGYDAPLDLLTVPESVAYLLDIGRYREIPRYEGEGRRWRRVRS